MPPTYESGHQHECYCSTTRCRYYNYWKILKRARVPSGLTHFEHYTKKQCMYQCLIDRIETECNCTSILFPQNRNESLRLPPCTFIQVIWKSQRPHWCQKTIPSRSLAHACRTVHFWRVPSNFRPSTLSLLGRPLWPKTVHFRLDPKNRCDFQIKSNQFAHQNSSKFSNTIPVTALQSVVKVIFEEIHYWFWKL